MRMSLNTEQTEAYNAIIKSVLNKDTGRQAYVPRPAASALDCI